MPASTPDSTPKFTARIPQPLYDFFREMGLPNGAYQQLGLALWTRLYDVSVAAGITSAFDRDGTKCTAILALIASLNPTPPSVPASSQPGPKEPRKSKDKNTNPHE